MAQTQVRIPSGSKLGSNFPPIEVMEIGQPGMPGELIIHNGRLWVYGPNGETYIDGGLIQTDAILAGSITADKLTIGGQNFSHDLVWTAVDEETISWAAGNLKISDGQEFTINAGSLDAMFDEDSEGANSPSTAANDSSIGNQAWSNVTNVYATDNSDATVTFSLSNTISNFLKITNFGFSIPSDRKILGIKVEVEVQQVNASGTDTARDYQIRIVKGNTIRSQNQAAFVSVSTTEQYVTYGGENNLWGERWLPDDINASDFGVALSYQGVPGAGALDAAVHVDHVKITVYFGRVAYIYFDGTSVLKVTNDPDEAIGNQKLLLAVVEKGGVGGKVVINPISSAGTTIRGSQIVTGIIQSNDGQTYFDLNEGRLVVNDGNDDIILIGKKVV